MLTFNAEPQRFFISYWIWECTESSLAACRGHRDLRTTLRTLRNALAFLRVLSPYTCVIYSFSLCASAFRNKELAKVELVVNLCTKVRKKGELCKKREKDVDGEGLNVPSQIVWEWVLWPNRGKKCPFCIIKHHGVSLLRCFKTKVNGKIYKVKTFPAAVLLLFLRKCFCTVWRPKREV